MLHVRVHTLYITFLRPQMVSTETLLQTHYVKEVLQNERKESGLWMVPGGLALCQWELSWILLQVPPQSEVSPSLLPRSR